MGEAADPNARRELGSRRELDSRRDLARLITGVENRDPAALASLHQLYRRGGRAHVVGVTGAPGTGKSTLVAALTKALRASGRRVAILSIDPSSPFSGGAILGDRIRMRDLHADTDVFIRSMASRGAPGGLARAAADVVAVLDAAGYDVVFVETVGAGQAEVDVARVADTVVVVEAPGLGDDVQAIKAGILEIADILVVNKADREGAERAISALQAALDLGAAAAGAGHHGPQHGAAAAGAPENAWRVPVLRSIATQGDGIDALIEQIDRHAAAMRATGGDPRRVQRARDEVIARLRDEVLRRALARIEPERLDALAAACAARELHPDEAVRALLGADGEA